MGSSAKLFSKKPPCINKNKNTEAFCKQPRQKAYYKGIRYIIDKYVEEAAMAIKISPHVFDIPLLLIYWITTQILG